MPVFVNARGEEFDVPDQPDASESLFIQQNGLTPKPQAKEQVSKFKDVLKSAISGLTEGAARAPLVGGDVIKLGMMLGNKISGDPTMQGTENWGSQPWIDAFKGSPQDNALKNVGMEAAYDPQTTAGRYTKAGTSAASGAVATAGIGAIPGIAKAASGVNAARVALTPGSIGINGGAGLAGELGWDASRGFDETKEGNPLAGLVAGVAAGTAGNAVRTATRPNAERHIYNALHDTPDATWNAAKGSIDDFKAAGSTSFTLADLPQMEPIAGLAKGFSNTTGGNDFRKMLGLRRINQDIPSIQQSAVDDIGPAMDPRKITRNIAEKGADTVKGLSRIRSIVMQNTLRNAPDLSDAELRTATLPVRTARIEGGNQAPGQLKALDDAEAALMGRDSLRVPTLNNNIPLIGNVRALSQNVKNLRKTPNTAVAPKIAVSNEQQMKAADLAEEGLSSVSPSFRQGMVNYRDFSENKLNPTEVALAGQVMGVNGADTLLSKIRDVPPNKVVDELKQLGASVEERKAIARLLAEENKTMPNLNTGSRGVKRDRLLVTAILDDIDPKLSAKVKNKQEVADQLTRLTAENSTDKSVNMMLGNNTGSAVLGPISAMGRALTFNKTEKEVKGLAAIMTNPTPENLEKLRQMSKIDPRARRALEFISNWSGVASSSAANPKE